MQTIPANVAPLSVNPVLETLILVARLHLEAEEAARLDRLLSGEIEWSKLVRRAGQLGVGPLLYRHVAGAACRRHVPQQAIDGLRRDYQVTAFRNMRMSVQIQEILDALHPQGIPIIVLKGALLAEWVYKDLGLRPRCDIDLLCRNTDLRSIVETLNRLGYRQQQAVYPGRIHEKVAALTAGHLPPFSRGNDDRMELHTNPFHGLRSSSLVSDELWSAKMPLGPDSDGGYRLSLEYLVLHLVHHLYKHMLNGAVALYWFCDLYEVLRRQPLAWDPLASGAARLDMIGEVDAVLWVLRAYWGLKAPWIPDELTMSPDEIQRAQIADVLRCAGTRLARRRRASASFRRLLSTVRRIEGNGQRVCYVFRLLFPTREFLMHRHAVKSRALLPLYYAYRIYRGARYGVLGLCGTKRRIPR